MRKEHRVGDKPAGGVGKGLATYPVEEIYEEAAFIAYHFHWAHDDIMSMEHRDRRRWCQHISKINKQFNDEPENIFDISK